MEHCNYPYHCKKYNILSQISLYTKPINWMFEMLAISHDVAPITVLNSSPSCDKGKVTLYCYYAFVENACKRLFLTFLNKELPTTPAVAFRLNLIF